MFRLFGNKILTRITGRKYCQVSNLPKNWPKELISLNLKSFLKKYFHSYLFFIVIPPEAPSLLKKFSTLLFDVTQIEKNSSQLSNFLEYKVVAHFDPAIDLLNQITKKSDLDTGFKFYRIGKKPLYIFSPGDFLPTHFSLRTRDAIEEHQIRTLTNLSDLSNNKTALIIKKPFDFNLALDQISTLDISGHEKAECIELCKKNAIEKEINIQKVIDCWNHLSEQEQENILNTFYDHYYQLYIEDPTNPSTNTIRFYIHDKNWDLSDARFYASQRAINNPASHINTAVQLISASEYRHSSVNGYYPHATSGGALAINTYCPGIYFLKSIDYLKTSDIGFSADVAMRHARFNPDKTQKYSDMLYPYNGFIPYWSIIYLKEACDALGIKTSNLALPEKMRVTQSTVCRP